MYLASGFGFKQRNCIEVKIGQIRREFKSRDKGTKGEEKNMHIEGILLLTE